MKIRLSKATKKAPGHGKKKRRKAGTLTKAQEQELILNDKSPFSLREAYNTLRTNIIFSVASEGCKVIGLTSAIELEGKSTNCINLALSFAETKARVLLLDCDLRRPNVARLLNLVAGRGISNVIVGLSPLDKVIRHVANKNLDVITSGDIPPNPTELLGSQKMQDVMRELSTRYDYILVDTPPVNVVADASIISKFMTGIVFVVMQGASERDSVTDAIDQLTFADAKLLGFLLNCALPKKRGRGKYYKKYKKYGYYKYSHYGYIPTSQPESEPVASSVRNTKK
jgi:capsular exopolysaccharide synthesis family protein